MSDAPRPPATLAQQADLLDYLIGRMVMRDGSDALQCWFLIERAQLEDLRSLAQRLHRIAPHEAAIKRMVSGR